LRVSDISARLLTVAFYVAYAFITEVFAPVWRATLLCAIYLGTRLLYRDPAKALGAAALGLLLFDPRQLFTASFDWPVGAKPLNNDSMVWRVSYSASSAWLEGDAEKQVERSVAALHHPTANLVKVGHHGSSNATTPELVASANPSSPSFRWDQGIPSVCREPRFSAACQTLEPASTAPISMEH